MLSHRPSISLYKNCALFFCFAAGNFILKILACFKLRYLGSFDLYGSACLRVASVAGSPLRN